MGDGNNGLGDDVLVKLSLDLLFHLLSYLLLHELLYHGIELDTLRRRYDNVFHHDAVKTGGRLLGAVREERGLCENKIVRVHGRCV